MSSTYITAFHLLVDTTALSNPPHNVNPDSTHPIILEPVGTASSRLESTFDG